MGEPPQRRGTQVLKGVSMGKKALHIVANSAVKQVLGSLGSPLIQVAAQGRVTRDPGGTMLIIERISTSRSTTLPIVASHATKQTLASAAQANGSHEITLLGRVVQNGAGNVLLLDRVSKATRLAIAADPSTRKALADLVEDGGGEVSVKAKVIAQGRDKVLVLAGEGCTKKRK